MAVARELAGLLVGHKDPRVHDIAYEIQTVIGAPMSTLNAVLDRFRPESIAVIKSLAGME